MTEQEWTAGADPTRMLEFLAPKTQQRKLALFGVARCRRIACLSQDERALLAIDAAERYADRKAKIDEVRAACRHAREDAAGNARPLGHQVYAIAMLYNAAFNALLVSEHALKAAPDQASEKALQCALLQEIFGNPFQRIRMQTRWRTANVMQICEQIYAESSFDRLPSLADALAEAGCTDTRMLSHCRSAGPHVKGCWVVDLLLDKK